VGRAREKQIHAVAVSIFSQKGYAAASLQEIADAVGILKGSLYHYISSKESLLYRIFVEAHYEARRVMAEVDALNLPPADHLREYAQQLTLFYIDNRERTILYFNDWRHLTGENLEEVLRHRREFEAYLRQIIVRAQEAGQARNDLHIKLATFYLLAAINGVVDWYRPGGDISAKRVSREVAELSCAAVLLPANGRPR
jgi:AcrR family transcriptional regulator